MITFDMHRNSFIDMITKMAIPIRDHKDGFLFPTIALTIRPDEIEWIGQSQYVTSWVRVKCATSINTPEPVHIPIIVPAFLKELKSLKRKKIKGEHFKDKNIISFSCDPTDDQITLIDEEEGYSATHTIPGTPKSNVTGMLKELPFRLERDTDIILFKNGVVRPEISGFYDVKLLQDLVKNVKSKKKEIAQSKDKVLIETERRMPLTYTIYVDGNCHEIKTAADTRYATINVNRSNDDVSGHGELHYLFGFDDVVNVLSGKIKFYAVDKGPLWIMQDTNQMKLRYLIAPATVYVY
jgi:hypothetical protein